jgi:hypothetical protein
MVDGDFDSTKLKQGEIRKLVIYLNLAKAPEPGSEMYRGIK